MADHDEVWVALTTKVPQALRHALRLACLRTDMLMQTFVTAALDEKLAREQGKSRRVQGV